MLTLNVYLSHFVAVGISFVCQTTAIQAQLHDKCGVYFSARDVPEGQVFRSLAGAFGLEESELPSDLYPQIQQLIKQSLVKFKKQSTSTPLLIVDDVQGLVKDNCHDGGYVLAWCLEMASQGLLSVLFIASEPVSVRLKGKSGYGARLLVGNFQYIADDILINALSSMPPDVGFTRREAEDTVGIIGGHMADLRRIQEHRVRNEKSVAAAVDQATSVEQQQIHKSIQDLKQEYRAAGVLIMEKLASVPRGHYISMSDVRQHCFYEGWVPYNTVNVVVDQLAQLNMLGRSWKDGREFATFHRPMQHHAFHLLQNGEEYKELRRSVLRGWFG
jgi:hypothetical protein